jgi:hypothetical protein
MNGTRVVLIAVFAICSLLLTGCGDLLSSTVTFTGQVRLSDYPPQGHGGVSVSTGSVTTWSDDAGWFSLSGSVTYDADVYVNFSKDGYATVAVHRYLEPAAGTRTIDLGDVTLYRQAGR